MTAEEYIRVLKAPGSRRFNVTHRQCIAYELRLLGYRPVVICKVLHITKSNINYMINTFSTMLGVDDKYAVEAVREFDCHRFSISPCFRERNGVMEEDYRLVIDNKIMNYD